MEYYIDIYMQCPAVLSCVEFSSKLWRWFTTKLWRIRPWNNHGGADVWMITWNDRRMWSHLSTLCIGVWIWNPIGIFDKVLQWRNCWITSNISIPRRVWSKVFISFYVNPFLLGPFRMERNCSLWYKWAFFLLFKSRVWVRETFMKFWWRK